MLKIIAQSNSPVVNARNENQKPGKVTSFPSNTFRRNRIYQRLVFFVEIHVSVLAIYCNSRLSAGWTGREEGERGPQGVRRGLSFVSHTLDSINTSWGFLWHCKQELMQKLCILPFISIVLHESGKVEKLPI